MYIRIKLFIYLLTFPLTPFTYIVHVSCKFENLCAGAYTRNTTKTSKRRRMPELQFASPKGERARTKRIQETLRLFA